MGDTVNQIPAEELTVSIFRENYPRELFKALKESGSRLEERYPGIYYVFGNVLFDTQIVVTGRLSRKTHSGLRILSRNAAEEDVRAFILETRDLTKPGDRNNADAVLQVSISANEGLYQKIRRDLGMCEALRKLMKDEIEETLEAARAKAKAEGLAEGLAEGMEKGVAEGMEKGMAEGMEKGLDKAMLSAVANLMDTMKWTAEQAMEAIKVPLADRSKYISRL